MNQSRTIIPTDTWRTITIPLCEQHHGLHQLTLTVPWKCLQCGAPRAEPHKGRSYDGSLHMVVDAWGVNPCGHSERYSQVRAAYVAAMRRRQIIRADGTIELLHQPVHMREIGTLIDASAEKGTDTVNLLALGDPLMVMFVDGGGYETEVIESPGSIELRPKRALKPVNKLATELYRLHRNPAATEIVGDVILIPDDDAPDGRNYL